MSQAFWEALFCFLRKVNNYHNSQMHPGRWQSMLVDPGWFEVCGGGQDDTPTELRLSTLDDSPLWESHNCTSSKVLQIDAQSYAQSDDSAAWSTLSDCYKLKLTCSVSTVWSFYQQKWELIFIRLYISWTCLFMCLFLSVGLVSLGVSSGTIWHLSVFPSFPIRAFMLHGGANQESDSYAFSLFQ